MSNETEREAYKTWHLDTYKVAAIGGSDFMAFQAGAAYQREKEKKLVEALEEAIDYLNDNNLNSIQYGSRLYSQMCEALATYKAAQEGK